MNISYAQHQINVVNPSIRQTNPSLVISVCCSPFCPPTAGTHRITQWKMKNGLELNMKCRNNGWKRVCQQGKRKRFTYQDVKNHLNWARRQKKREFLITTTTTDATSSTQLKTDTKSNSSSWNDPAIERKKKKTKRAQTKWNRKTSSHNAKPSTQRLSENKTFVRDAFGRWTKIIIRHSVCLTVRWFYFLI